MKTLGVIGGLGPMATACFLELIIQMTDAKCDQEHLDVIIYNRPHTPDRTAFILGENLASPLPVMLETGKALCQDGASCIAIPCITSHYFYQELQEQISIPIINILEETAIHLKEHHILCAGIMATDGTIRSELFQKALSGAGISSVIPCKKHQQNVMDLIYQEVKAGKEPDMDKFQAVRRDLKAQGAEAIILGCTELSVIKKNYLVGSGFLDAMEVLARRSVLMCEKPLRPEYHCLITSAAL